MNVGQLKSIRAKLILEDKNVTDLKCIISDPNQKGYMRFKLQFGNNMSKSSKPLQLCREQTKITCVELLEIILKNTP